MYLNLREGCHFTIYFIPNELIFMFKRKKYFNIYFNAMLTLTKNISCLNHKNFSNKVSTAEDSPIYKLHVLKIFFGFITNIF